ncbi:efflux RND transporter periplasmic adaptor subunit [Cloacibacterium sp.]|uniref:efflux RND transporter periplasmic adaptor subunit n=1 Tax=Cloacibacterium sp. TaxID=1913682 RepID=UPI0039E33521
MNIKKSWFPILVLGAIIYSCNSRDKQDTNQQAALTADFIELKNASNDFSSGYPATIEGKDNVNIKVQVTGYLQEVYVKEGQFVNKGQILFKIDPSVYNEQVSNSEASLKNAIANQASAKIEVDNLKPLVDGQVVSNTQLKAAQTKYQAATAQVAQAKATLGSSKINAGFTYIKAPTMGYIGRIPNRIGNLITPSDSVPLTTLSNISTVNVYFSLVEADYLAYMKNAKNEANNVELILADGSTYSYKGKLEAASGQIDKATGSMPMKVVFQNPEKLLRSGGTGRIVIHKNLENILSIPKTAVKDIQDKFFVYKLITGNKVSMVPISISGTSNEDYFVSSGLKSGDKIAINRLDNLTDGASVVSKIVVKK